MDGSNTDESNGGGSQSRTPDQNYSEVLNDAIQTLLRELKMGVQEDSGLHTGGDGTANTHVRSTAVIEQIKCALRERLVESNNRSTSGDSEIYIPAAQPI